MVEDYEVQVSLYEVQHALNNQDTFKSLLVFFQKLGKRMEKLNLLFTGSEVIETL